MNNPLQDRTFLPAFRSIRPDHVVPAVEEAIRTAMATLEAVLDEPVRTYRNTVSALDEADMIVERVFGRVAHLESVASTPELRRAYAEALPLVSDFSAYLSLNPAIAARVRAYADSEDAAALAPEQRRRLDLLVASFRRSGADLPDTERERLRQIHARLAELSQAFGQNTLDAVSEFELLIQNEARLAGLPASLVEQAHLAAKAKGLAGWRFTLQDASYRPFMQYSTERELRQRMYEAYFSAAGEGDFDNRPVIAEILALRVEMAQLLGYPTYADLRLETAMARTGNHALEFVTDLEERTRPQWQRESEELEAFARTLGIDDLQPWDGAFVAEELRRVRYGFDEEEVRRYFPLQRCLEGLFYTVGQLFEITITERSLSEEQKWHPEVRAFDVTGHNGTPWGTFYIDLFPRDSKRGGAWMNSLVTGGPQPDGSFEPHLALMCANFSPPDEGGRAYLTHREVETLWHEMGHVLHHLLSMATEPALAGTNVPRDWVELPSQILENWCWEREVLDRISSDEQGVPIPDMLLGKMKSARRFLAASAQMRQLSFAAVDLAYHVHYAPSTDLDALRFGQDVLARFARRPENARNFFLCRFSHIFAGGYSAGYYSYKWSEVLDADAFTAFRGRLFDPAVGRLYRDAILSRGNTLPPEEMFRRFLGRDPDPSALLQRVLGSD